VCRSTGKCNQRWFHQPLALVVTVLDQDMSVTAQTTGPTIGCAWTQTWTVDYTDACTNTRYTNECSLYTWTVDTGNSSNYCSNSADQQENVVNDSSTNL
jgi:hypothetical protein